MKPLTFFHRVAIPLALFAFAGHAGAENYPDKPLRMIVPYSPGGPNDILGRLVSQQLTQRWKQTVVVENRGGVGGTIGMAALTKMPGDGYTLGMGGSSNLAVAPHVRANLPYDPIKDLTPIISVAVVPYALAVNPSVPAKNVKELILIAHTKAGFLSYGSSGTGSMSHLAAELLKSQSKANIVHIPYKGTAPALTDVVTGQIDMMLADLAVIRPHADAGKLRVLGVTGTRRSVTSPAVPTIAESGLPGYEIAPWFGVVAPAGVPKELVMRLNAAIEESLKSGVVVQRLSALGYEPLGGSADQFAATIKADIVKYAGIVKAAGIKVGL